MVTVRVVIKGAGGLSLEGNASISYSIECFQGIAVFKNMLNIEYAKGLESNCKIIHQWVDWVFFEGGE